jgi:hypothetical protein
VTGSHRKTMIMPIVFPEVAVDPAVASSSSTSSPLVQVPLAGESLYLNIPEVAVAISSSTLVSNLADGVWRPLSSNTSTTSTLVSILTGGEWRPLPFNTTSTSPSRVRGVLAGDFRSLPSTLWASIHDRFPLPYHLCWSTFRSYVRIQQARVDTVRRQTDSRGTTDAEALCFSKHDILFQYALSEDLPYELHEFHQRFHIIYDKFQDELYDLVLGHDNFH